MKSARVVIFFLALCSAVNAQDATPGFMKSINRLSKDFRFHKALKKGERLLHKKGNDTVLLKTLGNLAWRIRDFKKAAAYDSAYHALSGSEVSFSLYAQTLMALSNYATVTELTHAQLLKDPDGEKAMDFLRLLDTLPVYFKDSADWSIREIMLTNREVAAYSPMYFGKGLVFVNAGPKTKQKPTSLYWLTDTTMLVTQSNGKPANIPTQKFFTNANRLNNYGPLSVDPVDSVLYFCMTVSNRRTHVNRLHIFSAHYKKGKAIGITAFPYNSDLVSSFHPAVSPDGRFLYFVSDKAGGNGGLDIYSSQKKPDGSWAEPVNIGPLVNSNGNEMFPYIDKSGNLYFSSDGWKGLGALDIFYTKMENGLPVSAPVNIGANRNSGADDFGIIIDENGKSGYFSSNRSGTDMVYRFSFSPKRKDTVKALVDTAVGERLLTTGVDGTRKQNIDAPPQTLISNQTQDLVKKSDTVVDSAITAIATGDASTGRAEGTAQIDDTLRYSVFFRKDETTAVSAEDFGMYSKVANELKKKKDFVIVLNAYTDYTGTTAVNRRVAQNRSRSVEKFLRSLGVPASKIIVEPFRSDKHILPPSAPGPYDPMREAGNRRVDMLITTSNQQDPKTSDSKKRKAQSRRNNREDAGTRTNIRTASSESVLRVAPAQPAQKIQETTTTDNAASGFATDLSRLRSNAAKQSQIKNDDQSPATAPATLLDSIRTAADRRQAAPIVIETDADSLLVELYDNGVADKDTVSIAYNDILLVDKKELSVSKPIRFTIAIQAPPHENKLVLFANNLGLLPPNSGLMIIKGANGWRKEIFIENQLYGASVVFFIKKGIPSVKP